VANYALTTSSQRITIGGRFQGNRTSTYYVINPGISTSGTQTLVALDPTHPILKNVKSFNGGTASFRAIGYWVEGASRIATWTDTVPLIGTREIHGGKRVDLNFYLPSSDADPRFWVSSTDGALIMANALTWVTNRSACASNFDCKSCANSTCQWCLDTNTCSFQDFTCNNRIANPGHCPIIACNSYSGCKSCTSNTCQWCLDKNTCSSLNFTCDNRVADPKHCPIPVCSSFVTCSRCLATEGEGSCSWCLDNTSCVSRSTNCKGHFSDKKFCSQNSISH